MSVLKARFGCAIAQLITSPALLRLRRAAYTAMRKLSRRIATVHYFHQHDDPYSQLLAPCLPALLARYRIDIVAHAVPAPDAAAAPDLQRLNDWSVRDAERLRRSLPSVVRNSTQPPLAIKSPTPAELLRGAALRKKMGHYLGAMLYFEGEWYWGTDRLHYLEQRLDEAGLGIDSPTQDLSASAPESSRGPLIPPRSLQLKPTRGSPATAPVIYFYCSLRSPYTYLAARQVRKLAQHFGAELRIRYVLPMVMRGLPVPLVKRLYILHDTKREALRLGMPFGAVVDPVGAPVEAGLGLLHAACDKRQGSALLESFLSAVFAEGIDAGSPRGLQKIAERAGIGAPEMRDALKDTRWREVAEVNRAEMLERGLWGVPSFRVNENPLLWGQDRLWMLEEDLVQAIDSAKL